MTSRSAAATLARTPTDAFNLRNHPYHGSIDCRSNFRSLARVVNDHLQHQATFRLALTQIDNCAERREGSRAVHNEAHLNAIALIRNLYDMVEFAISKSRFVRFTLSFQERPVRAFTLVCLSSDGSTETFEATMFGFDRDTSTHSRRNSTRRQRRQRRTRSRRNNKNQHGI